MKLPIPIVFFALIFSAFICRAQLITDVKTIPAPYDVSGYKGQTSFKTIKKEILLKEFDIRKPGKSDTLRIDEYDRNGRKARSVSFTQGKRNSVTDFSYPKPSVTVWRYQSPSSKSVTVCTIVHDHSGRESYFTNSEFYNGDTTSRTMTRFTYNKDSLLVMREDSRNGKIYQTKIYQYKGKNMVTAELKTSGSPYVGWISIVYNKDHLPEKQIQYGLRGGSVDSTLVETYSFAGKNLSGLTKPDDSDIKKMIQNTFTYDQQNRIATETAAEDTLYEKVNLAYQGKYLARTTVSTNTTKTLASGFYIPYMSRLIKFPTEFVTAYAYDAKGYLVKTEETLNGVLQSRTLILIENY